MGDWPITRSVPSQDSITQKNADTRPCLEWDLNPRSQRLSGRRQYVPQTARPLGPVFSITYVIISSARSHHPLPTPFSYKQMGDLILRSALHHIPHTVIEPYRSYRCYCYPTGVHRRRIASFMQTFVSFVYCQGQMIASTVSYISNIKPCSKHSERRH